MNTLAPGLVISLRLTRTPLRAVTAMLLSLTLANFELGSLAALDAEHRVVLDDLMSAREHQLHAPHIAEGFPAALDAGPIEGLEASGVRDWTQPSGRI